MFDDMSKSEKLYEQLKKEAEEAGYYLNPDNSFSRALVDGLLRNESRYGYRSCPCRLAEGDKDSDNDIICPCDYRDADVDEYGACYCALYVSAEVSGGGKEVKPIPERRLARVERKRRAEKVASVSSHSVVSPPSSPLAVYRCKVCGYLCAREQPPAVCPICKAGKERFEPFAFSHGYIRVGEDNV